MRPRSVARRLASEASAEIERFTAPRRAARFDDKALLAATGAESISALWRRLGSRQWASWMPTEADRASIPSAQRHEILARAERGLALTVDLLGSGPIALGPRVDWSMDYRVGVRWPAGYARRLDVLDLSNPSDVKFPWELSRMQWLMPVAQAYVLTGDEQFAAAVRDVIEQWIGANPYAFSVNWSVTMEVAIRTLTLAWFFHAMHDSTSWADPSYQSQFLRALYLHGDFISRNLERSDVNGNHYTADAAGLVFAGLFFGQGETPGRWSSVGWEILETEIERQVGADGVDFEMSTAYHRLVMELFLYPALYRERSGLAVPVHYRARLTSMALFVAAYSRPDGTIPLWGDADDGRALPFGTQPLNDHRYLVGLVARAWDPPELRGLPTGPSDECDWWFGPTIAPQRKTPRVMDRSVAFRNAGVYIMRTQDDHVFIDCGPIGLSGRGGHGHNDSLSFEVVLAGSRLIVDAGSYVYTSSVEWRNRFRGTAFHNTPMIDGVEQNRIVRPEFLWLLENDAHPSVELWQDGAAWEVFRGSHSGYDRLPSPVRPIRTVALHRSQHAVVIKDVFVGTGLHDVTVPYHFAPEVNIESEEEGWIVVRAGGRRYVVAWRNSADWKVTTEASWVSASYGVKVPARQIAFSRRGPLVALGVVIAQERPDGLDVDEMLRTASA